MFSGRDCVNISGWRDRCSSLRYESAAYGWSTVYLYTLHTRIWLWVLNCVTSFYLRLFFSFSFGKAPNGRYSLCDNSLRSRLWVECRGAVRSQTCFVAPLKMSQLRFDSNRMRNQWWLNTCTRNGKQNRNKMYVHWLSKSIHTNTNVSALECRPAQTIPSNASIPIVSPTTEKHRATSDSKDHSSPNSSWFNLYANPQVPVERTFRRP